MGDSEKIRGKAIFGILEQVKENHTILNIHVLGTDFDGISIILSISDDKNPRFFIDYPAGGISANLFSAGNTCYFEFSDDERIKYSFKTTIEGVFGKRIKFDFPEFIERSQRRKAFRISMPSGTKLTYRNNDNYFEFDAIDISEGGVLASLEAVNHDSNIFFKGNKLYRLSLFSKSEYGSVRIDIKSAVIVRVNKLNERGRITYGFRFTDIETNAQNELKSFIYYCQRRLLKKRGGIE